MKVRYFAWLRERLNRDEEEVDPPAEVADRRRPHPVAAQPRRSRRPRAAKPKIINAAIDAKMVKHDAPIAGAKVIALMPPMTGG